MGIIKLRPKGPRNDHHLQRSSIMSSQNEFVHDKEFLLENFPGVNSDYCELAEVGCEYVMIGGQVCSIPYELYDLPDLKKILSLETWNYHLTDDERFSLVAFLPDMDQETFWLTIKELLTGDDMFFGSPLKNLYIGLKGGLYSPRVTHLREGLQFLQKSEYYHSLRSYHENMSQVFVEMRRLWRRCQPNISVEERVHIWNSRKEQKPVLIVDLNEFPDEGILKKGDWIEGTLPLSKKTKYINENHDPAVPLNGLVCSPERKAKGVLKLKPIMTNLVQNQVMQPFPEKSREPSKQLPKGVLKIKPKYDLLNQEKPRTKPEQISADIWDSHGHAPRVSPPQFAFKRDKLFFSDKLPILHQIDRDGCGYRNPAVLQDWQRTELPCAGSGAFEHSERFSRKPKMSMDVKQYTPEICKEQFHFRTNQKRIFSQETGQIGEYHNEKKILNNTRRQRSAYESSADPKIESFPLRLENFHERRLNALISEAGSRISNNYIDNHDILTIPSDLEHGIRDATTNVTISGVEKSLMFPITYKRKKSYRKLNQVDSLKQQPLVVNLEPAATSGKLKPKPMAIKIKFRGLTG